MSNRWIECQEGVKDREKLVNNFLEESKVQVRECIPWVQDAGHHEMVELVAAVTACLNSAAQRNQDKKLKRQVTSRIRSLLELALVENTLRATDPGDMLRLNTVAERIKCNGAIQHMGRRIQELRREEMHEEMKDEFEASRQEQEKVREDMASKEPMDGVEADLEEAPKLTPVPDTPPPKED